MGAEESPTCTLVTGPQFLIHFPLSRAGNYLSHLPQDPQTEASHPAPPFLHLVQEHVRPSLFPSSLTGSDTNELMLMGTKSGEKRSNNFDTRQPHMKHLIIAQHYKSHLGNNHGCSCSCFRVLTFKLRNCSVSASLDDKNPSSLAVVHRRSVNNTRSKHRLNFFGATTSNIILPQYMHMLQSPAVLLSLFTVKMLTFNPYFSEIHPKSRFQTNSSADTSVRACVQ